MVHNFPDGFRPMLAGMPPPLDQIQYPVMVSNKLDGIRCLTWGGIAYSRKLKPLPNAHLQKLLSRLPNGCDGEIICPNGFNATQSAVMSSTGTPDFDFYIFDNFLLNGVYQSRYSFLAVRSFPIPGRLLPHRIVENVDELKSAEEDAINAGYEGLCIRSLDGLYKFGRSTTKQGWLLKLKRFADSEGVVVGYAERYENHNPPTLNELGKTKRSSHKENMRPAGDLGALICKFGDDTVRVGSGFNDLQRIQLWNDRHNLVGRICKYKYQPDPAAPKNAPRFPIFLGFRHEDD